MAELAATVVKSTPDGVLLADVAADAQGHKFLNDGRTKLVVKNGSGGSINVTVQSDGRTIDGITLGSKVVAVGAGERKAIGPFPRETYNKKSGADEGYVLFSFSSITSVTFWLEND